MEENTERNVDYFDEIYKNPSRNLNNVTRYSSIFCIRDETNGYHVIDMMSICLYIYEKLMDKGVTLDIRDLIYRCYIHDLDEVLTGDIQRNIKYYNDSIYDSISSVTREIMRKTYCENIASDIVHSKDIDNINGLIVRVADTIQSTLKIYEEVKLNNFHFNKIMEEHYGFLNNLRDMLNNSNFESNDVNDHAILLLCDIVDSFRNKIHNQLNKLKV